MTNILTAGVWTGKESTEKVARVKRDRGKEGTKGRQRRHREDKGKWNRLQGLMKLAGAFRPSTPHPFISVVQNVQQGWIKEDRIKRLMWPTPRVCSQSGVGSGLHMESSAAMQ